MNPCSHWLFNYRPEDHIFIRHYTGQQKPSFSYDNGAIEKKTITYYHCCSVAQLCSALCNPMDCSTPGFPTLHYLWELAETPLSFIESVKLSEIQWVNVHWVSDAIQPSVAPFSSCPQFFSASGSFSMSRLYASGGHTTHLLYFCTCLHRFLVQGKYLLIYKENDPSITHHF